MNATRSSVCACDKFGTMAAGGILKRLLVLSIALAMAFHGTTATLTLTHGRITSVVETVVPVEGVGALNRGDSEVNHYFDCITTDGNVDDLIWEKEQGSSSTTTVTTQDNKLRLEFAPTIFGIPLTDLGIYYCRDSTTEERVAINIVEGDSAVIPPPGESSPMTRLGSNISLRVFIDGDFPINSSKVMWIRPDTTPISSSGGGKYSLMDDNKRLDIQNLEVRDFGYYSVIFREAITTINLIMQRPITIDHGEVRFIGGSIGVEKYRVEGVDILVLTNPNINHFYDCQSIDGPNNLVWEKEGGVLIFQTYPSGNSLRMDMSSPTVTSEDLGVYTCKDRVTGDRVSINITQGLNSLAICPVEPYLEISSGRTVHLRVYAVGIPSIMPSEIIWLAPNGSVISSGGRYTFLDGNKRLMLTNVVLEDSGTYRIDIRRSIHRVTSTIELDVQVNPTAVLNPNSVIVDLFHSGALFTCKFTGKPAPSIVWERGGAEPLPEITRLTINETSMLNQLYIVTSMFVLSSVFFEDEGRYRCIATNTQVGGIVGTTASAYAELTVRTRLYLSVSVETVAVPIGMNRIVRAPNNSLIFFDCYGQGSLSWKPPFLDPTRYRVQKMSRYNLRLIILNFTDSERAVYTCSSDFPVNDESLFITNDYSDPDVYVFGSQIKYLIRTSISIQWVVYTSSQEILTVEWYHNNNFINTTNGALYSVGMDVVGGMSVHVLNITVNARDLLGDYVVRVAIEGRYGSDSFQLVYLDPPPSVTLIPSNGISIRDIGDETSIFLCVFEGTGVTISWTYNGGQPLPNGIVSSDNRLDSSYILKSHAGSYECTITDILRTSTTAIGILYVQYSPLGNITYERTSEISINQLIKVIADQGDPAPTFLCVSEGYPIPDPAWSVYARESLPDGVTQNTAAEITSVTVQRNLVWSRVLDYTDSGLYECISRNIIGKRRVVLDLLVQFPYTVSSIYPNSPVNSSISSFSNFLVPEGYSGTILTCAALGWPTPTIEWLKNGQALDGRIISDSTSNPDSAFVSARLRWTGGFEGSDVGDYTCIVRANDTNAVQSKSVSLELTIPTTSSPIQCSVASLQTYFQIRVFDTECLSWDESLKGNISRSFLNVVLSIIVAECSECNVTTDDVEIIGPPTCSNLVDKAALFRGSISTQQMREDIYCALSNWQQNRPIVQINNRYHLVDSNCSFTLDSPTSAECPVFYVMIERPVNTLPFIVSGGSGFALLTLISVGFVYFVYRRRKEKLLSKDASTVNPEIKVDEVAGVHYEYEMESRNINHDLVAGVHLSPEFVNRDTQNSPIAGVYYGNQEVESNSEDAKHRNEISTSDEDLEQAHRRYREQRETRHPDQGTSGMLRLHQGADLENLLYKKLKESNEERQSRTSEEPHYGQEIDYRDQKRRQKYKINTRSDVRYQSTSRGQEVGHREAKRKRKQKASNVEVKPVKFNIPTIVIN